MDRKERGGLDPPIERLPHLARAYKGQASEPRPREDADPETATHSYVGAGAVAWGYFEADDPDKRFCVLAGSGWRRATINPEAASYEAQRRVSEAQDELVTAGVLDESHMAFTRDHTFDNWSVATRIVSGKGSYSGAYNWQRLS